MFRSLSAITLIFAAFAAPAQTLRLSLGDAVRMAVGTGSQAELARSNEVRARIAQREALGNLLPQVDARLIRYNQSINLATFGFSLPGFPQVVGPFNVTDAQLSAAVQVFNLAALRQYHAMQIATTASRYMAEAAENDVANAVARLYLLVTRADTQIASREADVALFQRLLKQAQDEFTAGTGTRLDVAQAQVQVARARQALLVAQNDRENAALALLNAIGADEASTVVLTDTLPMPTPTRPTVEDALRAADAQRPELQANRERERSAKLTLEAARARRVPTLGLDYLGDMSGNKTTDLRYTRRIAGTISIPLLHSDIEANIARASLNLHDIQVDLAQQQRDVNQDVRRAYMNVQNAEARVAVATENVRVAEEALTVARDRRAAGYGTPVEVDRAQDTWRQAREDLIAAQADAASAEYELQHATGDIRKTIDGVRK